MDTQTRIENARAALHLNHGEIAKELGVSRAMYYCVKNGEKPLGNKACRELERLEGVVRSKDSSEAVILKAATAADKVDAPKEVQQLVFSLKHAEGLLEIVQDDLDEERSKNTRLKELFVKLRDEIDSIINEI